MQMGRLKYEKTDQYRGEVLTGNWFERRCSYTKDPHDFRTTYMNHYPPKPFSANDRSLIWDQIIKTQGYGPRVLFDHQAPHFLENKSTTYDLSYNHLPKLSTGPIPRELRFRFLRYEPQQDYAKNYGNITSFGGLVDYYKEKWRCENQDPRTTLTTHYQDTFQAPKKEDLLFRRWAIPLPNSSIMGVNNQIFHALKLRDQQLAAVPETQPVQFPYEPRCNPITWECPDKYKEVPDRCVAPRKFK